MREVRPLLECAEGYAELGMCREALKAIEALEPSVRAHPLVVLLKIDIFARQGKWKKATSLALDGCAQWPIIDSFFLKAGCCLLEQKDYHSAWDMLTVGSESLVQKPKYYFSMASWEAQLGLYDNARHSLESCFAMDGRYRRVALAEPDLQSFWESLD